MLTFFTIPKPWKGPVAAAQDNAIESWRRLAPDVQIIVFGDEEGIADAARRHGVEHIAAVQRNEHGTPLLDHAFATAQARARHDRVCYVNADIIFLSDFARALRSVTRSSFLMVGRRIDLDVPGPIDFSDTNWAPRLEARARAEGRLHEPTGIDYFAFPRGQLAAMPAFPVGRALWDNWMIHHARSWRIPVIDATAVVAAIHQNHDYGHVRGGQRTVEVGPEVKRNWEMVGPDFLQLTIADATHLLSRDGVHRASDPHHLLRRLAVWPALSPRLKFSVRVARYLYRAWRGARATL